MSYEKSLTFGDGTSKGPYAIIKASEHLEYYDDQFDCEPFERGIHLLDVMELSELEPEEMVKRVRGKVAGEKGKFIIGLGGDHAVTFGMVKGLEERYEKFSVIQFDAHTDFRDSWNGSSLNHACVARQMSKNHSMLLIGIRSMDIDEKKLIDKEDNVHIVKSYNLSDKKINDVLEKLEENVFISIDVDVFDPSFIRNTGTPEPGGISWNQLVDCLKLVFENKRVIGADIVEFAPKNNSEAESYALAKLVYKIMAMKVFYSSKKV